MKHTLLQMPGTRLIGTLAALTLLAGCATTSAPEVAKISPPTTLAAVGQLSPSIPFPKGYLDPKALPDSLALLPPPPAAGTDSKAADEEAFKATLDAPQPRWALAASDAELNSWAHIVSSFEPIVGTSLSDGSKPHAEMLLRRSITDAALSTYEAKNHYQRVRPFVENNVSTCLPQDEPALRKDGSYPSGHTAIGWMLALVLTELFPDKQDALLQRGYDYGQSRVVCRAHWMSDTVSGRTITSATFARLHSDPVFEAQLDLARAELGKVQPR